MFMCKSCGRSFTAESSYKGHLGHCAPYLELVRSLRARHLTPSFLKWWFAKKHETALHLANLFNSKYEGVARIHPPYIISLAHSYGIDTNGFSCYKNCPRIHNSYMGRRNIGARGNIGYVNRQTHLAAEGITNVYQRPEVKCKIKETLLTRYGVSNPNQLPWYTSNNGMESKPHKCVFSYIQDLGIPAISEMKGINRALFSKYNDELKRIYSPRPDIILPTLHVIIEIFGNRWHADPNKFTPDTQIRLWRGTVPAAAIWLQDAIRKRHLESFEYAVYVIWASQVKDGSYRNIVDFILKKHTRMEDSHVCNHK